MCRRRYRRAHRLDKPVGATVLPSGPGSVFDSGHRHAGLIEGYTYSAFGELSICNALGQKQSQSAFGNIFQYQGQVYDALTATSSSARVPADVGEVFIAGPDLDSRRPEPVRFHR
jgi:hypothetical protein